MKKLVNEKRGLSEVVTTVLIILVVLAALVLIWSAVRPLLTEATEGVSDAPDCLSIDLAAVSCKSWSSIAAGNNGFANVTIVRNSGEGDLTGVRIVLSDGTGSFVYSNMTSVPQISETRLYRIMGMPQNYSGGTVNVAALVGSDGTVCNPLNEPIVCS